MTAPHDKRSLPYGGAFSIKDSVVVEYMKSLNLLESLWEENITKDFCSNYRDWISKTKNNTIKGLDLFPYSVYSNGTTQAFEMFYIRNRHRRFRCFKGEYIYHQLAWRNNWPDWKFIEDDALRPNDAVVISLPFSNTGNEHDQLEWLLETCIILGIPVLVDCAYFGTCKNLNFDFTKSCITDVVLV